MLAPFLTDYLQTYPSHPTRVITGQEYSGSRDVVRNTQPSEGMQVDYVCSSLVIRK